MKKYRFFFHYYKQKGMMSVHFKKKCFIAKNVVCTAPCTTKWNKTQPMLVMQGFAREIIVDKNTIYIK